MSSRLCLRSVVKVTLLMLTVVAFDGTRASVASDDEILERIAELQHIPGDELPRTELGFEPKARAAWWITRDEAIEDTERFFYLLSHGWCGYEYFRREAQAGAGGIDPFVEAERAVIERLGEKSRWSPDALAELIHERLAFVTDCHLNLNDSSFCRHEDFWFDSKLEIHEEAGAYHFDLDGASYRLIEVDGASPTPHLYPSLNAAGETIHLLGSLSTENPGPLVLVAKQADEEIRLERRLSRGEVAARGRFAETRIGGVPVIRMRSFADYYGRELEALVERAGSYRGEPYVILDIRGNGGGNTEWPRRWIYTFTGASPSLKQALTELVSRTSMIGRANLFALMLSSYREQERSPVQLDFERFQGQAETFDEPGATPYWSHIAVPAIEPIPNPTTLIVIQDRRVASAGEGLVSYLLDQVENVVFVGENTMGALTFGQQSAHRLPHSRLLAYLPIKLNVPLDLEVREARGFVPDYWVPPQQALNHAVAAARAGTIPTQTPLPAGYFDAEFVPERPPPWWQAHRRDFVLGTIFLVAGGVLAIANRKKERVVFLVAGTIALALGVGYVYFGSRAGFVLCGVGCVYLVINLAKRGETR